MDPDPLTGVRDLELELRRSLDGQNCLISEVWHRREIQVADVSMARVIVHLLELELRLGYQHVQLILLGLQSARSVWRSACSADRSWLLAPHQFKVFLLFFSTNLILYHVSQVSCTDPPRPDHVSHIPKHKLHGGGQGQSVLLGPGQNDPAH